jgi:hypothetical protein
VAQGSYGSLSGTSMASPHIAAVAALLKGYNAGLSPDQVQTAMETSAVDLGAAGKDVDYGHGRVDAAAALTAANPTTAPTTTPTTAPSTAPTTTPTTSKPTATPTKTATTKPTPTKTTPAPVVKVNPVITSNAVSKQVPYGTVTLTSFTVTANGVPFVVRPAQLCISEKNGATFKCRSATTSATGVVTLKRTAASPFRVYLTVPVSKTSEAATSQTYAYTVQAVVSLARKSAKALTVTLAGSDSQIVEVQKFDGQGWTTTTTFRATSKYTINKAQAGGLYRVVVPNTALLVGATSNTVQM